LSLHATTCRAAVAYIAPCHQMKQQFIFQESDNLTATQWLESKLKKSGISPLVHWRGIISQSVVCVSVVSEPMPGSASCVSTVDKLLQR